MQALIEQLHAKRALLVIGPSANRSDEVWFACQALAHLPFVRVLSLVNDGAANTVIPVAIQALKP